MNKNKIKQFNKIKIFSAMFLCYFSTISYGEDKTNSFNKDNNSRVIVNNTLQKSIVEIQPDNEKMANNEQSKNDALNKNKNSKGNLGLLEVGLDNLKAIEQNYFDKSEEDLIETNNEEIEQNKEEIKLDSLKTPTLKTALEMKEKDELVKLLSDLSSANQSNVLIDSLINKGTLNDGAQNLSPSFNFNNQFMFNSRNQSQLFSSNEVAIKSNSFDSKKMNYRLKLDMELGVFSFNYRFNDKLDNNNISEFSNLNKDVYIPFSCYINNKDCLISIEAQKVVYSNSPPNSQNYSEILSQQDQELNQLELRTLWNGEFSLEKLDLEKMFGDNSPIYIEQKNNILESQRYDSLILNERDFNQLKELIKISDRLVIKVYTIPFNEDLFIINLN